MKYRILMVNKLDTACAIEITYELQSKSHFFAKWKRVYVTKYLGVVMSLRDELSKRKSAVIKTIVKE